MTQDLGRPDGAPAFPRHPVRGRFNAAFFWVLDAYINATLRRHKRRVLADLPETVVEIGPGVGANLRYIDRGAAVIAIEPNRYMHPQLIARADRLGVHLELLESSAEQTGLPDNSADAVISSLVLCSVGDPATALAEIRRILRPGGTFRFLEHVAAADGTPTRIVQRILRRPWGWVFEGCSCERNLESLIRAAGFSEVDIERYRIHSPFLPFNTHIAGVVQA